MRSEKIIRDEIDALSKTAEDYDTVRQSNDTCVAAGAHDALRWALGLAESSISEYLEIETRREPALAEMPLPVQAEALKHYRKFRKPLGGSSEH